MPLPSGLVPPEPTLFFTRNDPADPRMGDVALRGEADYARADVVVLGCPQDEGVRRNGGRIGAAKAPAEIRRYLYRLVAIANLRLFDGGDTVIGDTLEDTHTVHQNNVAHFLRDGKTVIVLGGGNDISYPDCAALSRMCDGNIAACNVDAHFDVREQTPRNSGTPYRQLLDEGLLAPANFWAVGHQPFAVSAAHRAYLRERGAHVLDRDALTSRGLAAFDKMLYSRTRALFWGLDMDVVRAADAPGVSAPNPTGIEGQMLCQIAALAGAQHATRILEISEVNPDYDLDGRTARLAAIAIWRFLHSRTAAIDG